MSNVFVFRIATDIEFIKNEINCGRLRQGWGNSKAELKENDEKNWVANQCEGYPDAEKAEIEKYYSKKYKNLVKMLEIQKGDIIIIPKTPDYTKFTICKAAGNYYFEKPEKYEVDDFHHIIPIDTEEIYQFSYHANEKCKIIHAKLRSYQSPINRVWSEIVVEAAKNIMESGNSDTNEQSTENLVKEIKDDIFKTSAIDRFRNLGNRETEKIVKIIFENIGYELIDSNSYDRIGGDADLIFADNSFSELMDSGVNSSEISGKVFVQVKNKNGTDYNDVDGVNQLIQRTKNENAAAKILVSTAYDFTDNCKTLANQNNVLLINGHGFLSLIFKYLD